jgi:1D-myo-inositol-triphosphate 3-kinase
MIDFAKVRPLPDGISINHQSEWVEGNHEDGYLLGIHSLIELFEQIKKEEEESLRQIEI